MYADTKLYIHFWGTPGPLKPNQESLLQSSFEMKEFGVQSSPGVGFVSGCGQSCTDRPLRANTADYLFSSFTWTEAIDKQIRRCFLSSELKRASGDEMPQCWPLARLKKSRPRRIHYLDAVYETWLGNSSHTHRQKPNHGVWKLFHWWTFCWNRLTFLISRMTI